jgi:DNA-binding MarR family transcriptional regulator
MAGGASARDGSSLATGAPGDRAAALADIEEAFASFASHPFLPRLRARISAAVGGAFDPSAYPVLALIDSWGPLRTTALAERMGLDVSTVSRKVGYLEEARLVTHAPDPEDRRAHLLEVTGEGKRILAHMQRVRRALFDEALAGWSADEIRRLAELLTRFTSALASSA